MNTTLRLVSLKLRLEHRHGARVVEVCPIFCIRYIARGARFITKVKPWASASNTFLATHFQILSTASWTSIWCIQVPPRLGGALRRQWQTATRTQIQALQCGFNRSKPIVVEVLEAHYFEVNRQSCHLLAISTAWKNPTVRTIHSTSCNLERRRPG